MVSLKTRQYYCVSLQSSYFDNNVSICVERIVHLSQGLSSQAIIVLLLSHSLNNQQSKFVVLLHPSTGLDSKDVILIIMFPIFYWDKFLESQDLSTKR
jgi:hypothetical protein